MVDIEDVQLILGKDKIRSNSSMGFEEFSSLVSNDDFFKQYPVDAEMLYNDFKRRSMDLSDLSNLDKAEESYENVGPFKSKESFEKACGYYIKHYLISPDDFNEENYYHFARSLYYANVKDITRPSVNSSISNARVSCEVISRIQKQKDLSIEDRSDLVSISIIKMMERCYDERAYDEMIYWVEKLNPEYLSTKNFEFNDGSLRISNKEKWYLYRVWALNGLKRYDEAMDAARDALRKVDFFKKQNKEYVCCMIGKILKEKQGLDVALRGVKEEANDNSIYKKVKRVLEKDPVRCMKFVHIDRTRS